MKTLTLNIEVCARSPTGQLDCPYVEFHNDWIEAHACRNPVVRAGRGGHPCMLERQPAPPPRWCPLRDFGDTYSGLGRE